MNIFVILIVSWLLYCGGVHSSYGYTHKFLGSGYMLLGPIMGAKNVPVTNGLGTRPSTEGSSTVPRGRLLFVPS